MAFQEKVVGRPSLVNIDDVCVDCGIYSGARKKAKIGRPPTSHWRANAVLNAIGLMSGTKDRTTPRPTACIATTKKARPPSKMPRSLGGAICATNQTRPPLDDRFDLTSDA